MMLDVSPSHPRRPKPKSYKPASHFGRPALSKTKEPEASAVPEELPAVVPAAPEPPAELPEPVFQTPEEVATLDTTAEPAPQEDATLVAAKPKRKWWPQTRKQWIITGAATVVVLGAAGTGWALTSHTPKAAPPKKIKASVMIPAKPVITYSNLSGLPITDSSLNSKPVTAVMVENSTDARPQSGLGEAGVVFEAQAEGGITRFMALYQDTTPTNVGPIRSARPYYVQWALGFGAAYAHVGGSPDALSDITSWGVQDMNQFYNGDYYHRITARVAPHNVYTGIDTLNQLEQSKGYSSTYTGFPRTNDATPMTQPTASAIDLNVSGALYNPHYAFNTATDSYDRSTDGTPDTDANTGNQLSPKVVIAIVVPLSQGALDASGAYYSDYNVLGSGTAYIFQNGGVTMGQWNKSSNTSQITFTANDKAIPLDRGQTWITAVSASSQVSYKGSASTPTSTAN